MPRTRTTKKLAQRIDLEYFKRSSPLRRWAFWLSVGLPAVALVWLAWHGVRGDRRVYSAGVLSASHAVLTRQCSACHVTQAGFFSEKVSDQKCLACHNGAVHHAAQEFTPSCASCHADHRGTIRLAATSDADCTQCHANLTTRSGATAFTRSIDRFEGNHPEFAVLRGGRGDPGTIQLNHYRHLQPNLLGPNGSRVQMVCTDCHRPAADATAPWPYAAGRDAGASTQESEMPAAKSPMPVGASSRAYMAPATYTQTCAACHSLQFDKRLPDSAPHDTPEKIHSFIVSRLQTYIAAHPADLRVPRDPSRDLPERAIPADYRMLTPQQWVGERTGEAEQLLWRKTCKECHTLIFSGDDALPKIALARSGWSTGRAHRQTQQSSDVLLPGIATCRSCHHAGAEAAESRCFECHTYHDPAQHGPAHAEFSLKDFFNGSEAARSAR